MDAEIKKNLEKDGMTMWLRGRIICLCHTTRNKTVMSVALTYSMEQSPSWEANRFSASQKIPCILWNPKVHYRSHKCLPPVRTLSQLDPVRTPHPTSWRSILILFSHLHLCLPSGLFPSGFSINTLYTPLLSPICATCPAHLILLNFITRTRSVTLQTLSMMSHLLEIWQISMYVTGYFSGQHQNYQ